MTTWESTRCFLSTNHDHFYPDNIFDTCEQSFLERLSLWREGRGASRSLGSRCLEDLLVIMIMVVVVAIMIMFMIMMMVFLWGLPLWWWYQWWWYQGCTSRPAPWGREKVCPTPQKEGFAPPALWKLPKPLGRSGAKLISIHGNSEGNYKKGSNFVVKYLPHLQISECQALA